MRGFNPKTVALRKMWVGVLAAVAATACHASDLTRETAFGSAVGSVQIEMARVPDAPLSLMDTISVRAIVRGTDGNLMPDVSVAWDLRLAPGEDDYFPAGIITQTGPNTAVVALQAPQGVVVAGAKGIFGELVLSIDSQPVDWGISPGRKVRSGR